MKSLYTVIGIVWLCSMWAAGASSSIAASSAGFTERSPTSAGGAADAPSVERRDPSDPRTDVLGNEVENAVADYRFDLGGDVYERHSPETAVPKLGSPTT